MSSGSTSRACIGVDVGGTFTDAVLTRGGRTWRAKAPTTPDQLGRGVIAALGLVAERSGSSLETLLPEVSRFGLGTTAVTNTLASRTGRRVGLLTTAGFEGMLPFAQGTRVLDEDGWLGPPPRIVEDRCIVGVHERVDCNGQILVPLDRDEALSAVRRLVDEEGIEALAVSYLWSFANQSHEMATVEAVGAAFPSLPVIAGSNLYPAIREYERTTYAVLNAYVSGALGGIEALDGDLRRLGLSVPLLLVHSAGGSITVSEAAREPLGLAASGPAAGVAAAAMLAQADNLDQIVTCDMGGTSFDVSLVERGQPARRTRGEVMGVWTALSLIDVESIGAGGGSVGWVDARGMLRVGPRSAGAVPGPACYGRGGEDATVTDGLVVLGFIDADRFLGGDFRLDARAARDACARLGAKLEMGPEETAWGIRQIALAGMTKATRSRLASLGLDPRSHDVTSFGGSGSLFTPEIGRALGCRSVRIPELASVLSAFGAATADVRRQRIRSIVGLMPVDVSLVQKVMDELAAAVDSDLAADGVAEEDRTVSFEADLRFSKQIYELQLPIRGARADAQMLDHLLDDFREEYAVRYGKGSIVLGAPIELVTLRAVGTGRTVHAAMSRSSATPVSDGAPAPSAGSRSIIVDRGEGGRREVSVYAGSELRPGHAFDGPALVDGSDTTVWVPEGARVGVDGRGTLVMELRP